MPAPSALDALRSWLAQQPTVSVTDDGDGWVARSGGVPVARAGATGEFRVMLPSDVAARVAAQDDAVHVTPAGVRFAVTDAASAERARALVARRIAVETFAWQYRDDGV